MTSVRAAAIARGCALAVALVVVVAIPTPAVASDDPLAAALVARDERHDAVAARALLEPLAAGPTDSAEGRDRAARASFLLGELDERARAYPAAVARYRAVLTIDPGNWYASTARARLASLRRYEGAFDALARLDAVRRDPRRADDPAAIDALAAEAPSFPRVVRDETLLFVAEAWVGRLGAPRRAIVPAMTVARDPDADPLSRGGAFELAYAAMHAIGDDDGLRALLVDPDVPPALRVAIRRDLRRVTLHRASAVAVALGIAATLVGAVETARRRRVRRALEVAVRPAALALLAVAALGGYALAEAWERGDGRPFLALGAALLAVHALVAAWRGGFGDRRPWLRVLGGAIAASCLVGLAYLVLERSGETGASMLDGFGL